MNRQDILSCAEYLDPALIEEAGACAPVKKANTWRRWGAMAACFCLIAAAVLSVPKLMHPAAVIDAAAEPAQSSDPAESAHSAALPAPDSISPVPEDLASSAALPAEPSENPSGTSDAAAPAVPCGTAPPDDLSETDGVAAPTVGENAPFLPAQGAEKEAPALPAVIPMIESFEGAAFADLAVYNGGVLLSDALTKALEAYGSGVRYRVAVELFSDGVQIYSGSEQAEREMERLAENGYTVALEKYYDGTDEHCWFTLHATDKQLESFSADSDLGYHIGLYDEVLGISGAPVPPAVFNAAAN